MQVPTKGNQEWSVYARIGEELPRSLMRKVAMDQKQTLITPFLGLECGPLVGRFEPRLVKMISKLPRWAWIGSGVLAFIAGTINSIGFLGFAHQGITHLTGSATLFGIAAASGDLVSALHLAGVVGAFFTGCVFGGFLIQDSTLKLGRRYGVALVIESVLLLLAVPLLNRQSNLGDYFASCAMGLQNGMVSTYSGAVLRTTHLTGVFTDLGIFIGHRLHGLQVDKLRVRLCLVLLGTFLGGVIAGTMGFAHFGYGTLYFPAALTGCVGGAYSIYYHRHWKDSNERQPVPPGGSPEK
jgi:uncharacterized membrane protein YoaK (UPF0700 family)